VTSPALDQRLPHLSLAESQRLHHQQSWMSQMPPPDFSQYSGDSKESSPIYTRGGPVGTQDSRGGAIKKKARSVSFGEVSQNGDGASVLFRTSKKKQSVDPSVYAFTTESALVTDPLKFDKSVILFLKDIGKPVTKMPSVDKKWLSFWSLFHGNLNGRSTRMNLSLTIRCH
jgi:hypothetical protein